MMMDIEATATVLVQKTRRFLFGMYGRDVQEASDRELFQAISRAFGEEIIGVWHRSREIVQERNARCLYYISMEYLPGKIFQQVLFGLHAEGVLSRAMEKLGRNLKNVLRAEYDAGLGNGGLGRLASCFLDSLTALEYPCIAYGLRYQYGIFQQIWDEGIQKERPDPWLRYINPWEWRCDDELQEITFAGYCHEKTGVNEESYFYESDTHVVRVIPYDTPVVSYRPTLGYMGTLRLWSSTVVPSNFNMESYNIGELALAAENTSLTHVLYPNDMNDFGKKSRLKQEYLLVSASVKDILRRHLQSHPDFDTIRHLIRIQINDTHPALLISEMSHTLVKRAALTWDQALEWTTEMVGFTNHTILREALEQYEETLFQQILPCQYAVIKKLNGLFAEKVRGKVSFSDVSLIQGGRVHMAHLAILGSRKVNGVSRLHAELLHTVFPGFAALYPERFTGITNGISHRIWLKHVNPPLSDLIIQYIGEGWIQECSQLQQLGKYIKNPELLRAFRKVKIEGKEAFIQFLKDLPEESCHVGHCNVHSLFDVQIKRMHEYKRQLLVGCHLICMYQDLLKNPSSHIPRTVIIAGKAASGYWIAKRIMHFLYCVGRRINLDPRTQEVLKVILVENYNVSVAEKIIPAADLSEQISTAGMEASGTGNMKLALNGALTIATKDGANIEMCEQIGSAYWPFSFGASCDTIDALRREGSYHPQEFITQYPKLMQMMDAIQSNFFAESDEEKEMMQEIYRYLMVGYDGMPPDRYYVLYDLPSYYETQKRVEQLYSTEAWDEYALAQITKMGYFSSDRCIREYNQAIWGLDSVSLTSDDLHAIQQKYQDVGIQRLFF